MNKILSPARRAEFERLTRKTKNIDEKDRLRAILAYDLGHDVSDIAEILQISESSTYNYIELKQNTDDVNSVIMFMDAVHPEYQSQAVYGWIPKGETKTLPTTNTQFRLHLNGAINLNTMNVFTREYDTIDAVSIISFFKDLEAENPYKTIHIICDNGRSNKNQYIQRYLETSRIKIHYLPPYSPNLNAIERLWKIMREYVTYNKYYPKFTEFKEKIYEFFNTTVYEIEPILKARINDKFEVVRHNTVQLSS